MDPAIGRALRESPPDATDPWQVFDALADRPVLVIRGALSDILSAATVERMQARYPQLVAARIPNRGHVPLLDEPESLAALDHFLAGLY